MALLGSRPLAPGALGPSRCRPGVRPPSLVYADRVSDLRSRAVPRLSCRRWRRVGDAIALSRPEREPGRDRCVRHHARGPGRSHRSGSIAADPDKPTNRERHTGGVRIQPGSYEEEALRDGCSISPALPEVGGHRRARAAGVCRDRVGVHAAAPAADAQPVQQHRSRSSRRLQPARPIAFRRRISSTVSRTSCARRACRRCWPRPTARRRRSWR